MEIKQHTLHQQIKEIIREMRKDFETNEHRMMEGNL